MSGEKKMQEFIFTFGCGQPLKNCYVAITAEDRGAARVKMFEMYGPKWAMEYDSREAAGVYRFNLKEVPFGTPNTDQVKRL